MYDAATLEVYLLLLLHFIQCKLHLFTSKIVLLLSDDCKHSKQTIMHGIAKSK